MRARAAEYAGLGFAPIPLRARTNKPACLDWPTLSIPLQWADAGDGGNIGLRAGDGIAFLDCDDDKRPGTSAATRRYLAGLGYYADDFPEVQTPSGGRHVYVSFRGGLPGHSRLLAPDCGAGEFRYGPAAQVAAPPSVTDAGSYQLVGGDLRQLPRLEVDDILPLLGNQDTGKADDVAAAILATAPSGAPGRIGRGTWALLRGDGCDRYPSRSEAEMAIVDGCVNAGLAFGAILGLFQTYPAAGKFAELHGQNPARAIGYLRRTWENAVKWTAAHPSEGRKLAFQAVQWAQSRPWPGRTGRTDHVVYLAHALTAFQAGKLEYNLSERELAERAGIGRITAHRANARLRAADLVDRVKQTDGHKYAVLWRLQSGESIPYPHSPVCEGMVSDCHFDHDAFRQKPRKTKGRRQIDGLQGGLGKTAAELWALLQGHPMTAAELAERSGRHVSTVHKNLRRMVKILDIATGEVLRLVEPGDGDTWQALDADLDAIARAIGTAGTGERQKATHAAERAGRKLAIDRQHAGDVPRREG
jgi:predicted transcriptional regulator